MWNIMRRAANRENWFWKTWFRKKKKIYSLPRRIFQVEMGHICGHIINNIDNCNAFRYRISTHQWKQLRLSNICLRSRYSLFHWYCIDFFFCVWKLSSWACWRSKIHCSKLYEVLVFSWFCNCYSYRNSISKFYES